MPAADGLEAELLAALREELGHVSAERVLSGPGLANIHRALARLHGRSLAPLAPSDITRLGLDGSDDLCRLALERFCLLLGSFAGKVALCYGPHGAVILALGRAPFRRRVWLYVL